MGKVVYTRYSRPVLFSALTAVSYLLEALGTVKTKDLNKRKTRIEIRGHYGKVTCREVWDGDAGILEGELKFGNKKAKYEIDMYGVVLSSERAEKVIAEALEYLAEKVSNKYGKGKKR